MDWQPIETAPRDGTWFVTFSPGLEDLNPFDFAVYDTVSDDGGFCKVRCGFQYATHWAPLPLSPSGQVVPLYSGASEGVFD